MLELWQQSLQSPTLGLYQWVYLLWAMLLTLEVGYGKLAGLPLFTRRDFAANMGMFVGYFLINMFWVHGIFALYTLLSEHVLWQLGSGAWRLPGVDNWQEWLLLFVLEDLCFYCFHRAHHRWRFFWAAHVPHHSSSQFNLSVAFRQTWVPFTAVIFWLPLPLLGFDPLMILTMQMTSLFFQVFLHTQTVPSLGLAEWVFNTPRHHRVHHACNAPYVDKNFGGILIVWDRLFGSFAQEKPDNPVQFGVNPPQNSANPVTIAFAEYGALMKDIWLKCWKA